MAKIQQCEGGKGHSQEESLPSDNDEDQIYEQDQEARPHFQKTITQPVKVNFDGTWGHVAGHSNRAGYINFTTSSLAEAQRDRVREQMQAGLRENRLGATKCKIQVNVQK